MKKTNQKSSSTKLNTKYSHENYFQIKQSLIDSIFDKYDTRKTCEEVLYINELGGIDYLSTALHSNLTNGINFGYSNSEKDDDLYIRKSYFGENSIPIDPLPSIFHYIWESFSDFMLRILIFIGILQTILGSISALTPNPERDWIDGVSILCAVFIVVVVSSYTNYTKEKKFRELNDKNMSMIKTFIKRDGKIIESSPDEVLVGDIVKISNGSILPADGILISYEGSLKIEESSLTGESDLIEKCLYEECLNIYMERSISQIPSPIVFSGTSVKEGNGWYMVLSVGSNSKKGKIQESVQQNVENDESKTPLENKLDVIANQIGFFGMGSGILTLIVLFIQFGINFNRTYNESGSGERSIAQDVIKIIILCIAIVVVAIPEGLPLAVTLSLAFSIKKMMKDNNLVRKMYACETMGGANFICSDKTGTLTKNEMNIFEIFNCKDSIDLKEVVTSTSKSLINSYKNKEKNKDAVQISSDDYFSRLYFELFSTSIICNIQMLIDEENNISNESKTDLPFALLLKKLNLNLFSIQSKYNVNSNSQVKRIPFNSTRKKMSTLVSHPSFPTGHRLFVKGAAEIILNSISSFVNPIDVEVIPISSEDEVRFEDLIRTYANKSLRTIAVAYKDVSLAEADQYSNKESDLEEKDLTLISIVGIKDTLREGVYDSIEKCNLAGINVIMVTGDLKETAVAISKECGIWTLEDDSPIPEYFSLTGNEFFSLIEGIECTVCGKDINECTDPKTKAQAKKMKVSSKKIQRHKIKNMEKFEEIAKDLRVLARSRPIDKYALVLGLRRLNNVVAVTGDGTNDAQALSKSDVGFAMGIQGSDIAKNSADIIILDDNFTSIVKAVVWGRNIFDCIRKFIQFQLTVNFTACFLIFITACIGNESPITAIQMLWLNMIMDSLGSLALATESPCDDILERKPYSRHESIINEYMWKQIIGNSIFLICILLSVYLYGHVFLPEDNHNRLLDIKQIYTCFETFPGKYPSENSRFTVLSGLESYWESSSKQRINITKDLCGDYFKAGSLFEAYEIYKSKWVSTTHMTFIYNIFVMYTLFNQINSRVLNDKLNILSNIHKNVLFLIIIIIEIIIQVCLIQFGSFVFGICDEGLTVLQWGYTVIISMSTFIVSFVFKLLPLEKPIKSIMNKFENEKKFVVNQNGSRSLSKLSLSLSRSNESNERSKDKSNIDDNNYKERLVSK